jgi:hypothetical protein
MRAPEQRVNLQRHPRALEGTRGKSVARCSSNSEVWKRKSTSETAGAQAIELLEALPVLPAGLLEAPEEILRRIFEWFQLQVRYDKQANQAHVRVAIARTPWIR